MKINFGNGNKVVREGIDTKNWPFKPLKDYINLEIPVNGFFTSLGKFGEQAVIVSDNVLVNMPARTVDEVKAIKDNPDYLKALMDGKMVINNIHMEEFKNGTGVAYDFEILD